MNKNFKEFTNDFNRGESAEQKLYGAAAKILIEPKLIIEDELSSDRKTTQRDKIDSNRIESNEDYWSK